MKRETFAMACVIDSNIKALEEQLSIVKAMIENHNALSSGMNVIIRLHGRDMSINKNLSFDILTIMHDDIQHKLMNKIEEFEHLR